MTKGWSKKGERDAEGDRDETNEAAQNLLGGILGEAHQVLSETRHELREVQCVLMCPWSPLICK